MSNEQSNLAKSFAEFWKDKGKERKDSQPFWLSLLRDVFGIEKPEQLIEFEDVVHLDKENGFIDAYIPSTHVLIEQKSREKDLRKPIKQSDGSLLTPFQQAKRYSADLPYSQRPRWIVTCNFKSFLIYDMENPNAEPEEILLENLHKEYYRLEFMINSEYVYDFTEGNGDDSCEKIKIKSGNLNDGLELSYKNSSNAWAKYIHFKYTNQPHQLIIVDNDYFEYEYSTTSLEDALKLMETKTIWQP